MEGRRRLFITTADAAILFTAASCATVLLALAFMPHMSLYGEKMAGLTSVLVPDGLAAWWLFRRLRIDRSRNDARRAATAFAVSAPVVLAIGYLLGLFVGGYAEVTLGSRFVLPALVTFIILLMVIFPGAVVLWALHPSGGMAPVGGSDQNEHR